MQLIEFLRKFFNLNRELIYFGYGLVFFILGLAIALQSRSYSRLDLARSLKWLALFGFTHAFNEWGDLFIPIQASYLSSGTVRLLHELHLLVLAISFAFLFEFGITLLHPAGKTEWLQYLPAAFLTIWILFVLLPLKRIYPDFQVWYNSANAIARYWIGFPAGLVAAYGIRKHTKERIVPLRVPHIVRMLRFAGIMMAIYSIFGGLIPPPVPFLPGNLINSVTFEQVFIAPPPVFRSLIGLGLAIAIIRALEVFDVEVERLIESMEQQQILEAERNRIARELHDGIIQEVYTAGLLVESAQKLTSSGDSQISARLERAKTVLNDAIGDLRRNLVELSPVPVMEPLPEALRKLTNDPRFRSLLDIRLDVDLPQTLSLQPARAHHILAVVNEALSNAARHARADHVWIKAWYDTSIDRLKLRIQDDGVGIPEDVQAGYGLRNMRDRARLLDGVLEISNNNGRGTTVLLDVPWEEDK